jgi:cell division septation protein DedD
LVWYDDPIIVTAVLLVVIIASGSVILAMRKLGGRKPVTAKKHPQKQIVDLDSEYSNLPFKISKSVQTTMASDAKNELRMLDLERDILGDALRRLYEAHAEGKITEQERDKMAITYKNRMSTIKESISKDESIVALHELEGMQEDLMKLFSERFGELTTKVEELRGRIDVKPIREIPIKLPSQTPVQMEKDEDDEEEETAETTEGEAKPKKRRKSPEAKPDAKSAAEKRIESIRSEVEKVLDKLGQMEIES